MFVILADEEVPVRTETRELVARCGPSLELEDHFTRTGKQPLDAALKRAGELVRTEQNFVGYSMSDCGEHRSWNRIPAAN